MTPSVSSANEVHVVTGVGLSVIQSVGPLGQIDQKNKDKTYRNGILMKSPG